MSEKVKRKYSYSANVFVRGATIDDVIAELNAVAEEFKLRRDVRSFYYASTDEDES